MGSTTQTKFQTTVVSRIAGEDIKFGDYVSVFHVLYEFPSYFWSCSGSTLQPDETVKVSYLANNSGRPFKVLAVCLPFVYAKPIKGGTEIFDTRKTQLVRLDPDVGRTIWKRLRKPHKKKK